MLKHIVLLIVCAMLAACAPTAATPTAAPTATSNPPTATAIPTSEVEFLVPEVIATYPHDSEAFTQGLLWHDGSLYESTGREGQSNVREVNPATGEVIRQVDVADASVFGEGLALVDDRLIEITWQSQVAYIYDLETFEQVGTFEYEGQGWGICYDGEQLVMSDGSPNLFFRDVDTFELTGQVPVTLDGQPVANLNELECVRIMRIDPATGEVTAVIDATGLLTPEEAAQAGSNGVLNGIAYVPDQDIFYITGKLWPHLFAVRFVPAEGSAVG
jgi:glutaminyl-peptide cyclotransferase